MSASEIEAPGDEFLTFLVWALFLCGARVALLKCLTKLSRSDYAKSLGKITKHPHITNIQVQRESVWIYGHLYDLGAAIVLFYAGFFRGMPLFNIQGLFIHIAVHVFITEMVFYWIHRLLHQPYFYKQFHFFHHKSINTEPTTALSFDVVERLLYTILFFSVPPAIVYMLGAESYAMFVAYFLWFDLMNEGGHANFEMWPRWYRNSPLRYLLRTASYHAIHHTKFRKNFALFMPYTDFLFGTVDWKKKEDHSNSEPLLPVQMRPNKNLDFLLLVHAGAMASELYSWSLHPIIGPLLHFKNKYSHPLWMYPFYLYLIPSWIYMGYFDKIGYHEEEEFMFVPKSKTSSPTYTGTTWIVRNFGAQYIFPFFKKLIQDRIERAILDAQKQGIRVVGLGNFNKAEWINHGGLDIVERLKDKLTTTYISHGDTLSASVVYHYAMKLREQKYWFKNVFMTGATSKIGRAICLQMVRHNIKVLMFTQSRARYEEIAEEAGPYRSNLIFTDKLSAGADCDLWLTGKMIPGGKELLDAIPKFTTVVNFAVPDPLPQSSAITRPDILHLDSGLLHYDPKVMSPYFTWLLPEGNIYACLAGCIVHAVLGIQAHEVGPVKIEDMDKYWDAAMEIGFTIPPPSSFYQPISMPPPRNFDREEVC